MFRETVLLCLIVSNGYAEHSRIGPNFQPIFQEDVIRASGSAQFQRFRQSKMEIPEPDLTSFGRTSDYDYADYATEVDYDAVEDLEDDYPAIQFEQVDDTVFNADPIPVQQIATVAPKVQENEVVTMNKNIDFSQATRNADGKLCILKEEMVESVVRQPLMQCTHRNVEKCHYTYVTQFIPTQEEVCTETFQKQCQITFRPSATKEKLRKCYTPMMKTCNGNGPEICKTVYESACTTKYMDKSGNGSFVGDTKCERLPIKICGKGCVTQPGEEECHEKEIDVMVDLPEEICDLNPQKNCRMATKMVPKLTPEHECTQVPQEVCHMSYGPPTVVMKPLKAEWCLDEAQVEEGAIEADLQREARRGRRRRFRGQNRNARRFRNRQN